LALFQQKIQLYSESNFIQARLRKYNACPTVKQSYFPGAYVGREPTARRPSAKKSKFFDLLRDFGGRQKRFRS
jgi:hypothetical protein